jgi:hypothetical protein
VRIVAFIAAATIAAASALIEADGALAQAAADGAHPDRFLLFSGFDVWRNGGFLHGGMLWSPDGLSQDGFTLKVLFGAGQYRYRSGDREITGTQELGGVMPGWRWKSDRLEVVAVVGLDIQSHDLKPEDLGNRLRGVQAGLRAGADLWYQPNGTMMFNGSVSGSSVGTSYWTRGAVGWRVSDRFWAGPEIGAEGDTKYRQLRLGLHATGFRTGPLEWSLGAGYVHDTDRRAGAYGRIWLLTRQ